MSAARVFRAALCVILCAQLSGCFVFAVPLPKKDRPALETRRV